MPILLATEPSVTMRSAGPSAAASVSSQPRPSQARPRTQDPKRAECGTECSRGQSPDVVVSQNAQPPTRTQPLDEIRRMSRGNPRLTWVSSFNSRRVLLQHGPAIRRTTGLAPIAHPTPDSPRWTVPRQLSRRPAQPFVISQVRQSRQRHPERAGHSNRWCSPHRQGFDHLNGLADRGNPQVSQLALIYDAQCAIGPRNRTLRTGRKPRLSCHHAKHHNHKSDLTTRLWLYYTRVPS